jgi:Protein of unknown function (DUF1553)/Protein of unknown function (DUF1549)
LRSVFLIFVLAMSVLGSSSVNCTYLADPAEFEYHPNKHWRDVSERTDNLGRTLNPTAARMAATSDSAVPMPRKNFIDEYIFGRMERDGVPPAPIADDQAFLRRVFLDLTGRLPSAEQVRAFAYDTNTAKRDAIVDALVGNVDYINKWTTFFGDLYKNSATAANVVRYQQGRDAFYIYLKDALTQNKRYDLMAWELMVSNGDNWVDGAANWAVGGTVAAGPAQDTYDGQAVNAAQMFLGINAVDCLLCHDGARHLDGVNLWASQQTRSDLWGLSAFFARTRMPRQVVSQTPMYAKFIVSEAPTGEYQLNTTTGNRSARVGQNRVTTAAPRYPFTGQTVPANAYRRAALADMIVTDRQFARAIVNYIWEKFMVVAFVSPSNGFDPARLDPRNPPPEPWTLQPTNPELLEALAQWFQDNAYDLRALTSLIAKSNAYQLSSQYAGTWKPEYVPYYARKFARRLDAEEIHDAIVKAAGVMPTYSLDYNGSTYPLPPVNWAMEMPDTSEPRSNQAVVQFMSAFGRGDRDQTRRDSSASSLQALNMMNNAFVMNRIHNANNGSTVQQLLRRTTDPLGIIESLYLTTLNRFPSAEEITIAQSVMSRLGNQRGAESLQWALLNKLEFIYSY